MVLLLLAGMGVFAYLITQVFGGDGQTAVFVWLGGCGLALAFPLLALALAVRAFRGIAAPLASLMEAADAVAEGDFGVRVPEHGPGDFGRLAHAFNRMAKELDRAEQQRRNLTADVAHELRTPLHIIQGNLEGMVDGIYEPSEEQIGMILDETLQLARLVDDLQTLSLAETGQLSLVLEALSVSDLLNDVKTSFSGPAEEAGIHITLSNAEELQGLELVGDAGRLDQVLSNLVANAVRHTHPGGVIEIGASDSPWGVRITIRDTGEGISSQDLPYVFDRFWKGDRSVSGSTGAGAGLGLAIARQLVQAHGGDIWVESEPGAGTLFTIDLPGDRERSGGPRQAPAVQ